MFSVSLFPSLFSSLMRFFIMFLMFVSVSFGACIANDLVSGNPFMMLCTVMWWVAFFVP